MKTIVRTVGITPQKYRKILEDVLSENNIVTNTRMKHSKQHFARDFVRAISKIEIKVTQSYTF